jgi:predicted Zn finger-like uncharacterized protein
MKITCQSCQSKYNVADEKVQGKIVKIRCRKCGSTIVVQGNGGAGANGSAASTGAANGAAVATEADGVQWHVNVGEGEPRTMSLAELVEAYNAGSIAQDTFIWTDGMDDWKPLVEVEPVISALHAGHAPAAAPPAAPEPEYRAPVAEMPYVAPAAAPAPVAMAAPEAPAEPRRAAVKREARARDLFASGVGAEEVQTSAPAHPQMMSAGAVDDAASKLTGQRNENSVLFSLAVLTKEGGDRAPEEEAPKATSKNSDDSGLIDLKALALKAESMRPAAMADAGAFASPLGLGGPSMGGPLGVLGSPLGEAPAKSKLPLYIGLGAGGVLLIVLGMFIGIKGLGSSTPAPEPSAAASAAPAVTATAEPTATASATAEASATAASPSAAAAAKPKAAAPAYHAAAGGGGAPKPATAGGGAAAAGGGAATPPAAPPPPKKAASDCGCNGDLMCLMKCSTGH